MTTVRDLIKSQLRLLGVLRKGEDPAADEMVDAMAANNAMISSWANDGLLVPYRTWEAGKVLTPGTGTYTIGTGLNIDTVRPISIVQAYVRDSGNTDSPLAILTDEQYNGIWNKSETGLPTGLNYDTGFATGRIRLDCLPSLAYTLYLLTEKPLTAFATLDDVIALPPGWERTLKFNGAIEYASEYGVGAEIKMPEYVPKIAQESLELVKLAQAKNRPVTLDPNWRGASRGFNVLTRQ